MKLGQILLEMGCISEAQLHNALNQQRYSGMRIGQQCCELGFIAEDQLLQALATQFHFPMVDLNRIAIDRSLQEGLEAAWLRDEGILPLSRTESGGILLGIVDPLNLAAADTIGRHFDTSVHKALISQSLLEEHLLPPQPSTQTATLQTHDTTSPEGSNQAIDMVNGLLQAALHMEASDIHFEAAGQFMRVRMRVDGCLMEHSMIPKQLEQAVITRIKVLAHLDIAQRRLPQDGKLQHTFQAKRYDMRVSTVANIHGEGAVLRILPSPDKQPTLEELEMGATLPELLVRLGNSSGMILVAGPTGSGKTTTLYAMIRHINSLTRKIITIEDPVEHQLPLVNQIQVNTKAGLDFPTLLPHLLRQDPDVIVIGEIRDRKTAAMACQAALTGHLVLSTIHTTTAAAAVNRLLDIGVEPFLVASGLSAVIGQRLVRRLCPHCRCSEPSPQPIPQFTAPYFTAKGCPHCNHTGYRHRSGVFELLCVDSRIRQLISHATSGLELESAAREQMHCGTLWENGLTMAAHGVTSPEEVLRVLPRGN
ncbi:type II secretion system protein E [Desulfurispirillum indicum S5]|uniref:Type II secretion system protein E n=1 Tax=Desulfurispirillum indicum (strain ATCC BAA-1389 / DSM 22839 / S5) TaxID=653733 RepID=E6W6Q8_DESIS|nr:GspE/PulE family protein [Desulfurispirillum indicum]ADU65058.1 type II secretion system protein E [Desulfurispirillum indicum S5]